MDKIIGFFAWIIGIVFAIVFGWSLKAWCTKNKAVEPKIITKIEGHIVSALDRLSVKKAAKEDCPSGEEPTIKRTVDTV